MIGKIALEGLEFHSFHGVYPHELESGNFFEVDLAVETDFTQAAVDDDLTETVNYETLFKIVKDEMDKPSKLLETVAQRIVDRALSEFSQILTIELKISKLNPPIGGKCKSSSVSISKSNN